MMVTGYQGCKLHAVGVDVQGIPGESHHALPTSFSPDADCTELRVDPWIFVDPYGIVQISPSWVGLRGSYLGTCSESWTGQPSIAAASLSALDLELSLVVIADQAIRLGSPVVPCSLFLVQGSLLK